MISIKADKKLDIILPNTNKALAEVLKSASPKELEVVTKGKDLKSIMNSLLKESSLNSTSDKALLELVKNNPTLKNLGNANQDIKELLNSLKSDKNLQPIEKLLQKFLPNIKELKNINVKTTVENSGVFLESKLKDIQNPQLKLNKLLTTLSNELKKSKLPVSKMLNTQIKEILSNALVKENPKELQNLAKSVQNIVNILQTELKGANPVATKEFSSKLSKLEHLIEPKNLEKDNFNLSTLKDSIKQVTSTLENSFTKESKGFLDALNKIFTSIKYIEQNIKENPKTLENITKSIENIVEKLKNSEHINNKDFSSKLSKLENIIQSSDIKLLPLQDSIKQVTLGLQNSFTKDSGGFIDALNKIFATLQSIKQDSSIVKTQLQLLVDKKIPIEIKNMVENIKTSIQNSDSLFSKPAKIIFDELLQLKTANKLSPEQNIKEILSNDLKAVLHKASDEISKLTIPNQSDVLKQIDKLSLQIDYYQLVSHLSNSSSLYIPFAWDEMQEGNITIKRFANDKFYCDIDLKLKEYGELKLRLTLYDKNQLNIHINSNNEKFKDIIKENIPSLRRALIDIQITPREIHLFNNSKSTQTAYENDSGHLDIGFEIKA